MAALAFVEAPDSERKASSNRPRSFRERLAFGAELGDVLVEALCRIEIREQCGDCDLQRLAEIEHFKIAHPDELAFDFGNAGTINFPTKDLQPRREVRLASDPGCSVFSALAARRCSCVLRSCGRKQRRTKFTEAPVWEPNAETSFHALKADSARRANSFLLPKAHRTIPFFAVWL